MISAFRTALALVFTILATILGALVAFPWTWISGSADVLYAIAMSIARTGLRIAGVRIQIEGMERINPSETYIFMCNHVSNLDPPILIPALPRRTSVLVKKELFQVPILGRAMRMGDLVAVDRRNREAAVNSMRAAEAVMSRGLNMTVFPEGTRSRDGRLLPFKKGPFYLAMDSGIPVVAVTILGSESLMPKGSSLIHPGTVRLVFHAQISPKQFTDNDDLISAVRSEIASALPPSLREPNLNSAS
ncbi:MAG: 1-acyl-sn-glycerol-3-phosphate acyltransferase [Acidobacteria bacterium]|nr:MAG: 1-acyl-sn-glycerol-3-phosphate acyltransferase [Acidobacteriota bacterium]PYY21182.1 MAG: 1-acyl-sn-glycerol-3-phosphate acyltransferase [Acidobacteriota bacterium]